VSSSSSARNTSLGALLEESFEILLREVPEAHRRMCTTLKGAAVSIHVDDDHVVALFDAATATVGNDTSRVTTDVATSRQAIIDVVEGRLSLYDAVLADVVRARAPLDALVQLYDGLVMYVHGAVRSPSFPKLLERFRKSTPS
jgi:N-methylhydantoinase B/oxoprolinase/acetone carboxylase alpha subunit